MTPGGSQTTARTTPEIRGRATCPAEFARDTTFGYVASNLAEWVEEDGGASRPPGRARARHRDSACTDSTARGRPADLGARRPPTVVDAVEEDLRQLTLALIRAGAAGSLLVHCGRPNS